MFTEMAAYLSVSQLGLDLGHFETFSRWAIMRKITMALSASSTLNAFLAVVREQNYMPYKSIDQFALIQPKRCPISRSRISFRVMG